MFQRLGLSASLKRTGTSFALTGRTLCELKSKTEIEVGGQLAHHTARAKGQKLKASGQVRVSAEIPTKSVNKTKGRAKCRLQCYDYRIVIVLNYISRAWIHSCQSHLLK